MSWLCHRRCRHCYEDRFRPYAGEELRQVVDEAQGSFAKVIANFPEQMTYLDSALGPEPQQGRPARLEQARGRLRRERRQARRQRLRRPWGLRRRRR